MSSAAMANCSMAADSAKGGVLLVVGFGVTVGPAGSACHVDCGLITFASVEGHARNVAFVVGSPLETAAVGRVVGLHSRVMVASAVDAGCQPGHSESVDESASAITTEYSEGSAT